MTALAVGTLCLVIPVYNEEECIESVLTGWIKMLETLKDTSFFILAINDGSRDRSLSIIQALSDRDPRVVVIDKPNGGHGSAVRCGYEEALRRGSGWIFQVDSDDQFYPEDFLQFWEKREQIDFAVGIRNKRHDAPARLVITRILKFFIVCVFGTWVPDANSPFRLMRASLLRDALGVIDPNVFAPNIFLSLFAAKSDVRVSYIPVRHKERETGVVSILRWKLLSVCLRTVRELATFRPSVRQKL